MTYNQPAVTGLPQR